MDNWLIDYSFIDLLLYIIFATTPSLRKPSNKSKKSGVSNNIRELEK